MSNDKELVKVIKMNLIVAETKNIAEKVYKLLESDVICNKYTDKNYSIVTYCDNENNDSILQNNKVKNLYFVSDFEEGYVCVFDIVQVDENTPVNNDYLQMYFKKMYNEKEEQEKFLLSMMDIVQN